MGKIRLSGKRRFRCARRPYVAREIAGHCGREVESCGEKILLASEFRILAGEINSSAREYGDTRQRVWNILPAGLLLSPETLSISPARWAILAGKIPSLAGDIRQLAFMRVRVWCRCLARKFKAREWRPWEFGHSCPKFQERVLPWRFS